MPRRWLRPWRSAPLFLLFLHTWPATGSGGSGARLISHNRIAMPAELWLQRAFGRYIMGSLSPIMEPKVLLGSEIRHQASDVVEHGCSAR